MILATTAAVSAFSVPPAGGAPPGHFDLDARLERLSTVQREMDALSQEDADRLFFAIGREVEKHADIRDPRHSRKSFMNFTQGAYFESLQHHTPCGGA